MGKFILKLKPDKEAPTNFKSDWARYGITIVDDSTFPKMLFIETDCPSNFPPGLLEKWDVFPEKKYKVPNPNKPKTMKSTLIKRHKRY